MEVTRKIKQPRLHQLVAEEITRKISLNEWEPGTQLPGEEELCKMLGVSRHALREAIRSLEELAILETKNGQGTYVCTHAPTNFSRQMSALLVIDKMSIKELCEFRYMYEPAILPWTIARILPEELKELEEMVVEAEKTAASSDRERFSAGDRKFHQALAKASGNRFAEIIFCTLREIINDSFENVEITGEQLLQSAQYHRKIFDAVKNKDVDEAVRLMQQHILNVETQYEKKKS